MIAEGKAVSTIRGEAIRQDTDRFRRELVERNLNQPLPTG